MKTSNEIIENVKNNKIIEDYNLIEMYLHLNIMKLLEMYNNNQINLELASKLKTKAVKNYEDDKFKYEMYENTLNNYVKTTNLRVKLRKQLNSDTELNEILNTTIELIELYSDESFT